MSTKERTFFLTENVEDESTRKIVEGIIGVNIEDDRQESEDGGYERKPIHLYIGTRGGNVYDALGLIDIIESSKTPVFTFCVGVAMSSGLDIFLAGARRFTYQTSTFMYHDGVCKSNMKTLEQQARTLVEHTRLTRICDERITARTLIPQSKLDEVKRGVDNWYIDAKEAVALGIAHEIIGTIGGRYGVPAREVAAAKEVE